MDQIIIGDQYIKIYFCQQVDIGLDLSHEQSRDLGAVSISLGSLDRVFFWKKQ